MLNVFQRLSHEMSLCVSLCLSPCRHHYGEEEFAQLGPPGLWRGSSTRERWGSEEKPLFQHAEEVPRYPTGKTAGVWFRGRHSAGVSAASWDEMIQVTGMWRSSCPAGVWWLWRAAEGVLFWQEPRPVSVRPPLLPDWKTPCDGGALRLLLQVCLLLCHRENAEEVGTLYTFKCVNLNSFTFKASFWKLQTKQERDRPACYQRTGPKVGFSDGMGVH